MEFWFDQFESGYVRGWAFSDAAADVRIEAWSGAEKLGSCRTGMARPDVTAHYHATPNSANCGFILCYPLPHADHASLLPIEIRLTSGGESRTVSDEIIVGTPEGSAMGALRGLPMPVGALLRELDGDGVCEADDAELARRVAWSFGRAAAQAKAVIIPYFRFLNACKSHFEFVERAFPRHNAHSHAGEKDFFCGQNTAAEMLAIANHLYVLKSHRVDGSFAEFGCFKGFSSAMLSYACSALRVPMHIFDSFQGLPNSDSIYYRAGDFTGELDEVTRNIAAFGCLDMVKFHRGFFSDTVPVVETGTLCCMWMDVDLMASSEDVMKIFPRLHSQGAVFCHECAPGNFAEEISAPLHSDSVIPPILAGYRSRDAKAAGRFIRGNTGSFWRDGGGIPVISPEGLEILLEAATGMKA